jgi:hypothetical protein
MNFIAHTNLGPRDHCPTPDNSPDWGLGYRLVPTDSAVDSGEYPYPNSGWIVFVDPGVHTVELVWDSQYCADERYGLITNASVITEVF